MVAGLQAQYTSYLKERAKLVESRQRREYARTIRGWQASTATGTRRPLLRFETKIVMLRGEPVLILRSWMSDGVSKQPSLVWYLLDQGRKVFRQPSTSPPIAERGTPQTTPGSLDSRPSINYTGDTMIVPAGTLVDEIKPRGWSGLILESVKQMVRAAGLNVIHSQIDGL